ncbi:MAG TPA: pilus assembly protein TadG-related protein [Dehalococcoidia bacterium]|jgi:hypothetical protein|nr:pilus assembly protein TadG-related protein [Dehalococcoidia bacterium]
MLLIFALVVVPVTAGLGVVAVDASMWQSERRGAQKDADLAALAGALELAKKDPNSGDAADATDAATNSSGVNDEAGNASIENLVVDNSCFGVNAYDAVTIDVDHDSRTFFGEMFGFNVAPEIGGHAKACAGAAQEPDNTIPIQIDTTLSPCFDGAGEPRFTSLCPIEFGSDDANPRGIIDLQAPDGWCSDATASGDIEDLIEFGSPAKCRVNETGTCDPNKNGPWMDCVAVQPGNPTNVARAFEGRIAREGACDTDGNGIESFDETVQIAFDNGDPFTNVYEPRDCDPDTDGTQMSPRLVTIIVLEDRPTGSGNTGQPIYAFAGFYISGCVVTDEDVSEDDLDPFCDVPGGGSASANPAGSSVSFVGFNAAQCGRGQQATCTPVPSPTPGPSATPTPNSGGGGGGGGGCGGGCGHVVVWGRFVNLIFAGHEAGAPTDATTIFSISLVE